MLQEKLLILELIFTLLKEIVSIPKYSLPSCLIWRDSMKSWWEVKKKTASHVTQVNYDNHVPDNIVDNAQRDSDEKWFGGDKP